MKKIKKILSILLSAAMLLPTVSAVVHAEETTTEVSPENAYFFTKWATLIDNELQETSFVEPTDKESYGGNGHSAHIYNGAEVSGKVGHLYTTTTFSAGTYNVEMDMKGITLFGLFGYDSNDLVFSNYLTHGAVDSDGWHKVTGQITLKSQSKIAIRFWMAMDLYFDNVKITDANGNVKFSDDFESVRPWLKPEEEYSFTGKWAMAIDKELQDTSFVEPTDKESYGGNGHSAHIYNGAEVNGKVGQLYTTTTFSAGTYNVEMDMKGITLFGLFGYDSNDLVFSNYLTHGAVDSDGWHKVTGQITLKVQSKIAIRFWMAMDLYFDNIKISNESGTVLLFDDFETVLPIKAENAYNFTKWDTPEFSECIAETSFIEPTKCDSYGDGVYSMHIYNKKAGTVNPNTAQIKTNKVFPAGEYNVEMYANGMTLFSLFVCATNGIVYSDKLTHGAADSNGWHKITGTVTLTTDSALAIRFWEAINMCFDNIKIKDSNGNVVFFDDFESVTEKRTSVINLLASPNPAAGNSLIVSWVNPEVGTVESYDIYVDGTKYEAAAPDLTAGAFNKITVSGLENYKEYTIKLVEKMAGKDQREYVTTGVPDDGGASYKIGDWNVSRCLQCDFKLEKDAQGNTAMRMYANIPTTVGGVFPSLSQQITLRKDTKYQIGFRAKSENLYNFTVLSEYKHIVDGVEHKCWHRWSPVAANTDGWKTYSEKLDNIVCDTCGYKFYDDADDTGETYDLNILFLIDSAEGSITIDDVEMYALDAYEDTVMGDNQIRNGNFELTYSVLDPEYSLITEGGSSEPIRFLEEGKVRVTAKIKNYTMDNFSPFVGFALYNGTKLEDMVLAENKDMSATSAFIPAEEFTASFDVPALNLGTYKIKTFYWNALSTMNPIDTSDFIEE